MNLLEIVLLNSGAEKYIPNFRKYQIDSYILKLLTDEDLQLIGVDNEQIRAKILLRCKTLQIPSERIQELNITSTDILVVLNQINFQLNKHYANLSCCLHRKNPDLCNIKLEAATQCLDNCLCSLKKELDHVKLEVLPTSSKRHLTMLFLGAIGFTGVFIFALIKYGNFR